MSDHSHTYRYKVFLEDKSEHGGYLAVTFLGIGTRKDGNELIIVVDEHSYRSINFDRVGWIEADVVMDETAHNGTVAPRETARSCGQ